MPELPEVETIVRDLTPDLLGRRVTGVQVLWPRTVATPPMPHFADRLLGQQVTQMGRRGKILLFTLDRGDTLLVHLRMTGHLGIVSPESPVSPYLRLRLALDDGRELRFTDTRKFGRVYLVSDVHEVIGDLGPEPLDAAFTPGVLAQRLGGRRAPVKSLLLDQRLIAGIGNLYADEALFQAGLAPQRAGNSLSQEDLARLHAAIRQVLWEGIADHGASVDNYRRPDGSRGAHGERLAVYGRAKEPCSNCGTLIERIVIGGRSAYFCPHCQV